MSGLCGSIAILPMCCVSASPRCVQLFPASSTCTLRCRNPSNRGAWIRRSPRTRHRRRRSDRDGADRCHRLRVEHRLPYAPRVDRLPHSAVHGAEVELVHASRHPGRGSDTPTAERAEHAPLKSGKKICGEPRRLVARERSSSPRTAASRALPNDRKESRSPRTSSRAVRCAEESRGVRVPRASPRRFPFRQSRSYSRSAG